MEFVNLYSRTRGMNRFPALVRTLELLGARKEARERGYVCPDLTPLKKWIEETDSLSAIGIREYAAAQSNGVLFYPIIPGQEVESWSRLRIEAAGKVRERIYAGTYMDSILAQFDSVLREEPKMQICTELRGHSGSDGRGRP